MIKRIRKVKKTGIFRDYSWDNELREFRRYNLFYGYNGSGKTTITQLFAAIDEGTTRGFPDSEYEVETDSGLVKQGEGFHRKVRVFNEDYIKDAVHRVEGKAKPIFILGKENKQLAEKIEKNEKLLTQKRDSRKRAHEEQERLAAERGTKFTDIARLISSLGTGQAARTYNKTKAETAFEALTGKDLLSDSEIDTHKTTLVQQSMPRQLTLVVPRLKYKNEDKESELAVFIDKVVEEARGLCAQTVESVAVPRLLENADIAGWVERGIELHEEHKSARCEYCDQPIPKERIEQLANHFNQADRDLKKEIDASVSNLERAKTSIQLLAPIDKANLYDELRQSYQSLRDVFTKTQDDLMEAIVALANELTKKKSQTTESISVTSTVDPTTFLTAMARVNSEIEKHNSKANRFQQQKETSLSKLETHYLSSIYDEIQRLDTASSRCQDQITVLDQGDPTIANDMGINALTERIAEDKAKISSVHKGCDELNKRLKTFLGRSEIVFEAEEEGYLIKRNGEVATHLSEGEKNAIAFVHFTVHLLDQDFAPEEGIIVVDDPVSSLDSNSQFQAFSLLKNAVSEAHQVFVFTHNFDFLRLLLNWLSYVAKGDKSHYMLQNPFVNDERTVCIRKLDRLLQDYESEYHYLFKRLHDFKSDGTIASVYDIPNVARKVLETFLMFRVPNSKSPHEKLKTLGFDPHKREAIHKFTNDQSHLTGRGFDPSLVGETQNNVAYLLEMIREEFPQHYEILMQSLGGA